MAPAVARADRVDEVVRAAMRKRKIPGLSLAIVRDGKVVKVKGYGFANLEHRVPATPETIYQSGSVGKQFTAALVMRLVEEGKLRLDESIRRHFTDAPETWEPITVRHLLTHTSGIKNYGPADLDFRRDYTEEELVKIAVGLPLDFPAGEQWRYSNTGYVLLGILIRKVTGRFYGDLLHDTVFAPLGMKTARVISEADLVPNRAAGYRLVKGEVKNQEWVSPTLNTTADGALYVSVRDLIRWDAALTENQVLRPDSWRLSWSPVKLNDGRARPYGFGWAVTDANGHRLIEHGGAWQGFTAHIARYVDDRLTVIVLTNLAGTNPTSIAHAVAGVYIPGVSLASAKPIPDPDPQIASRLRELFARMIDGTPEEQWFTPAGWARVSANLPGMKAMQASLGPAQSIALLERKSEGELRIYRYRVRFRDDTMRVTARVAAQDKIDGLSIEPE
jgi:CubicO group peptidase (beta-lactamase class C family)